MRPTSHISVCPTRKRTATRTSPTTRATGARDARGVDPHHPLDRALRHRSGGPLYAGKPIRAVDCGDIRTELGDPGAHARYTEQAVRKILQAGALPIVLGGDHSVQIPVLKAFEGQGAITLVQIDQHIDWRDEVNGVREGLSSPIRRASEMAHIGQIFQIGLRASGSARIEEAEAALAYGAHLITAWELHDFGMDAILARIPDGGRYYLTVDLDGMDPAIAPAVAAPCPGGVTFRSGAETDPRTGSQGARCRDGRCRSATRRCQPDHVHHGRPADRQFYRHGGSCWVFRPLTRTGSREAIACAHR